MFSSDFQEKNTFNLLYCVHKISVCVCVFGMTLIKLCKLCNLISLLANNKMYVHFYFILCLI